MVEFISGGFEGGSDFKKSNKVEKEESKKIEPLPETESWTEFIARNIAKFPVSATKALRGGFGLGHVERSLAEALLTPEEFQQVEKTGGLLPGAEQIQQEAESIFPKYLTENKPGDESLQNILTQIPILAATGGLSSLPALLKGGATLAGIHGGSRAGRAGGEAIGQAFGSREQTGNVDLQKLLGLVGEVGGGFGGAAATHAYLNRPSKTFPQKVYDKNVKEFEANKTKRIQELESEIHPVIAEKEASAKGIANDYAQEKTAFDSQKNESIENLFREHQTNKAQLLEERNSSLDQLKQQKLEREQNISELKQTEAQYDSAREAAKSIKAELPGIGGPLREIKQNAKLGVEKSEQRRINNIANQIEKLATRKNLPLQSVVTTKKNLNASIYDKNLPTVVKEYYVQMRNLLNEHIAKIGEEHPEHARPFIEAEARTAEYKKLAKATPEFEKQQKIETKQIIEKYKKDIKDLQENYKQADQSIKRDKFPIEKDIFYKQQEAKLRDELGITKRDLDRSRKEIGKESYDKLIKSEVAQNKLADAIHGITKQVSNWGLSALGFGLLKMTAGGKVAPVLAAAGGKLLSEARLGYQVYKQHPEIFNEFTQIIKEQTKKSSPQVFATQINQLGAKVEELASTIQPEESKVEILSGGLE